MSELFIIFIIIIVIIIIFIIIIIMIIIIYRTTDLMWKKTYLIDWLITKWLIDWQTTHWLTDDQSTLIHLWLVTCWLTGDCLIDRSDCLSVGLGFQCLPCAPFTNVVLRLYDFVHCVGQMATAASIWNRDMCVTRRVRSEHLGRQTTLHAGSLLWQT